MCERDRSYFGPLATRASFPDGGRPTQQEFIAAIAVEVSPAEHLSAAPITGKRFGYPRNSGLDCGLSKSLFLRVDRQSGLAVYHSGGGIETVANTVDYAVFVRSRGLFGGSETTFLKLNICGK